jgi:hypothetical protein
MSKVVNARKLPVVVRAEEITEEILVDTAHGEIAASPGDFLITAPDGDQWPIRRDIFERTYEVLGDGAPPSPHNDVTGPIDRPHFSWDPATSELRIKLQDGPIKEVGSNGIQIDEVVEWCRDMIRGWNVKHPCRANSLVITKLEEALLWLMGRKLDRIGRGVEGTNKP